MQPLTWTPPVGPLGRLTSRAYERAAHLGAEGGGWRARAGEVDPGPSFWRALRGADAVSVIAELKRSSPSRGALNLAMDVVERAHSYVTGGAAALSVLTEPEEFGGAGAQVTAVAIRTGVPVLKKDFHVADEQVFEARALGASAMLFIARALEPQRLQHLVGLALELEVEPVVEVRSEEELWSALRAGARVVGVNARDLETLAMDPSVTARILPAIPVDRVAVAESGLLGGEDVARVAALGADAVLVGTALSLAEDPVAAVRRLAGVPRRSRAA